MAKIILGMTMSLDGYINDPSGGVGQLYSDLTSGDGQAGSAQMNELMQESIRDTGAVVLGKNSYLMGGDVDDYADSYEYQVPIFVVTREVPAKKPKENENLTFTFVTDGIESALSQARAVAGERNVQLIGGAITAQQALRAGLVDEIQIDIMPILLGGGLRLFENIDTEIRLEKLRVIETPVRTSFSFRVLK